MSAAVTPTTVITASGRRLDLARPLADHVSLGDIAHSLARLARFNGHTGGPLPVNVADHSLLVEQLLPADASPALRLAALLHDAHEAYVGDIITPLREALIRSERPSAWLDPFNAIVRSIQAAVHAAVALPYPTPEVWASAIKAADLSALAIEGRNFLPVCDPPVEWPALSDELARRYVREAEAVTIHNPEVATRLFAGRAMQLMSARHGLSCRLTVDGTVGPWRP